LLDLISENDKAGNARLFSKLQPHHGHSFTASAATCISGPMSFNAQNAKPTFRQDRPARFLIAPNAAYK
jgi:hypothetical protein